MKKINNVIFVASLLVAFINPGRAIASSVLYEKNVPAAGGYMSFCNGNYHGRDHCNFTQTFSFDSDQIVTALTWYDLGCNSRDESEMDVFYELVNADNHNVVAETTRSEHLACSLDYPPGHNIPTTLEISPTRIAANQAYYLVLRASNNERARAYWGVNQFNQSSFQVHGMPAPKDPVILVPGMMGSSLQRTSDGKEIWPNVNEMILSGSDNYLDELKLDSAGSQVSGKEMAPGAVVERVSFSIFGQDLASQAVYGNLTKEFMDRGYTPGLDFFEVPYDWRLDLRGEVARLDAAVAAAIEATAPPEAIIAGGQEPRINIVAHSMGGLLVKQYLSDPEKASLIDKVVMVGVPQLGAPAMFKALNYGDNLGFKFPVIEKDILSHAKVKDIAQNMPGAYELLPSRRYVAASGGYVRDFRNGSAKILSYDEIVGLMTANPSDSRNSSLLAAGESFHGGVDALPVAGPDVYNITACGNPSTLGEIRLYDDGKIDISGTDGDGTVPTASAAHLADAYSNYFISWPDTGIDHGGLVKDSRAVEFIERMAEGVGVQPGEGIGDTPDICQEGHGSTSGSLRFSTHSPVELHVYDSTGRHVGPSPDGNIDLGIPGGSYMKLGGNTFIFVPAGDAYRLSIDSVGQGQFTLKAETLDGPRVAASTNYIDVPLASASTAAEATFSGASMDPVLALDSDGDGAVDINIQPTSRLFNLAAADSEPPQLAVSGIPTGTIAAGAAFSVNFSATDSLSGVATTSATLDGVAFGSGSALSVHSAGQHTIVLRASDKAGNPRVIAAAFASTGTASSSTPSTTTTSTQQTSGSTQKTSGSKKSDKSSAKEQASGTPATTTMGQSDNGAVMGAATTCLEPPINLLGRGRANDRSQVVLLQSFLNGELGINIPLTGFFGPITELAVKIFQLKYYYDVLVPAGVAVPTGFVGKYTLAKMKTLACSSAR